MLTLRPVAPRTMALSYRGQAVARIRETADGQVLLTNVVAGHTAPAASLDAALATARRIARMLRAGAGR